MTWWSKVHALPVLVLAACLAPCVAAMAGGALIPVPNLLAAGLVPVVVDVFVPLLPVIVWAWCLDRGTPLRTTAARPQAPLDLALLAAAVAPGALVALGASQSWNATIYLRGLAGCLGLAAASAALTGTRTAAVLPGAWVLAATIAGDTPTGAAWWAWPAADPTDHRALLMAALCAGGGTVLLLARGARPPRPGTT